MEASTPHRRKAFNSMQLAAIGLQILAELRSLAKSDQGTDIDHESGHMRHRQIGKDALLTASLLLP